MKRLFAIGVGLSILLNAFLGGEPYQTLSARTEERGPWWLRRIIDYIAWKGFGEHSHCRDAHKVWIKFAQDTKMFEVEKSVLATIGASPYQIEMANLMLRIAYGMEFSIDSEKDTLNGEAGFGDNFGTGNSKA